VSNFSAQQIETALQFVKVDTIQSHYSMLERSIEEDILPLCLKKNIGVIAYRAIERGLLTGKFHPNSQFSEGDIRANNTLFQGEVYHRNLKTVGQLILFAEKHNKTIGQVAISWSLSQKGIDTVIVGARTSKQLLENASASGWILTNEALSVIESILKQA
jgi:aryl-alcohol dehydrogenase-like predicted oxidoreductase